MSVQIEKLEKSMAKLTIEVSAEEFEKALQTAYLKNRGKISDISRETISPVWESGKISW